VWRVEATLEGQPLNKIPLVVKLYQESLYPIPEEESERGPRGFHSPPELIEKEATAYRYVPLPSRAIFSRKEADRRDVFAKRLARESQGSDIPLCYGFYNFRLPSGEETVGLVLEDLVEQRKGITVETFLEREAKAERLTFEAIDRIVSDFPLSLLTEEPELMCTSTGRCLPLSASKIAFTKSVSPTYSSGLTRLSSSGPAILTLQIQLSSD